MSLVGPRPCIPYETELFEPHHFDRFLVPAGMTGLWQVAARAHSTFKEALDLDAAYARNWSLRLDIWLLARTPPILFRGGRRRDDGGRRSSGRASSVSATGARTSHGTSPSTPAPSSRGSATSPEMLSRREVTSPSARDDVRTYGELLADPELDAVAIVTPVSTHYDLAVAALDAGKHVFIEKPLAASSTEALDLIRRAESAGLVLLPGPHVPLQPTGGQDQGAARQRRARRDLLRLDEPRQSGLASAGRQRRLGSRRRTTSRSCGTGSDTCRPRCPR